LSRNRVEGRRYVWFDYDTWCNQSVRDFFESVWDAAFACPDHFAYTDKPKWMWFNIPQLLPRGDQYRSKDQLYGVVPLCGVLMSQDVLARLVEEQVKDPATWRSVFCELRVGTLLKKCGVPIRKIGNATGLSACGRARAVQLASQGFKSIVHPVKTKLPG
jgi:hypothetical protein